MTDETHAAVRRLIARDLRRCLVRVAADRGCLVQDLSGDVTCAIEDFGLACIQRLQERVSERPTVAPDPWPDGEDTRPMYHR